MSSQLKALLLAYSSLAGVWMESDYSCKLDIWWSRSEWQLLSDTLPFTTGWGCRAVFTSHKVTHKKNPIFPTAPKIRSKVALSVNPRNGTFQRLTEINEVQLLPNCPPGMWHGVCLRFFFFSVLFWILSFNPGGLYTVWSYSGGHEFWDTLPKGKYRSLNFQ